MNERKYENPEYQVLQTSCRQAATPHTESHLASKEQKVKVGGAKYVAFQLHQRDNMERMNGRKKSARATHSSACKIAQGALILQVPCCIGRERKTASLCVPHARRNHHRVHFKSRITRMRACMGLHHTQRISLMHL